jgi:hypothetical protein
MGAESGTGRDPIVVGHEQQPVMRVVGVVVTSEAEAVMAVELPDLGVGTGVGLADINGIAHVAPSNRICPRTIPC